jgi:hypothetical protein
MAQDISCNGMWYSSVLIECKHEYRKIDVNIILHRYL